MKTESKKSVVIASKKTGVIANTTQLKKNAGDNTQLRLMPAVSAGLCVTQKAQPPPLREFGALEAAEFIWKMCVNVVLCTTERVDRLLLLRLGHCRVRWWTITFPSKHLDWQPVYVAPGALCAMETT